MTLILSVLMSLSIANASAEPAALDYEGHITKVAGLDSKRANQSCAVTLQRHRDGTATFFFAFGDSGELHGIRKSNDKRAFTDYAFKGEVVHTQNDSVGYEDFTLDISGRNSEKLEITRKIYEYTPNSFYSATLSSVECKAKLKVQNSDETATPSASSSSEETDSELNLGSST